jgi:hypothetical protein
MPQEIFSTKKHKISTLKKETMVDIIQKRESKKQLGPGNYPVANIIKGSEKTTRNMTGVFNNGLCKSNSEQMLFIADARINAKNTPQVGTY